MRRRFQGKTFDEINVTPLIDTLFFLLVIFMITAPLLEYSINVSPPKMDAVEIKPNDFMKVIHIQKTKVIQFEKKTLTMDQLLRRLAELKKSPQGPKLKIFLRADRELRYGDVIDILKTVKKAGHADISLVTESEK
ncbi:MAG: Biopolymer transport protein ExbD [Lentisphaerae bacterium ADurb.Bin242]|nr:MAG: Biopolymer transport protein ExbD [Lentisphaerae bacterium ADurb.Bin242]